MICSNSFLAITQRWSYILFLFYGCHSYTTFLPITSHICCLVESIFTTGEWIKHLTQCWLLFFGTIVIYFFQSTWVITIFPNVSFQLSLLTRFPLLESENSEILLTNKGCRHLDEISQSVVFYLFFIFYLYTLNILNFEQIFPNPRPFHHQYFIRPFNLHSLFRSVCISS